MPNENRVYPKRYKSYTATEIYDILYLRDSPSLIFTYKDIDGCVQNSHLTDEELFSVPGFKDSKWIYIRETHEWIPIFHFDEKVNQPSVDTFLDIEPYSDTYNLNDGKDWWWATPKGFPREQHE